MGLIISVFFMLIFFFFAVVGVVAAVCSVEEFCVL